MTVAAASNFSHAIEDIAADFRARSGMPVRVTVASTGKLYAQIVNGAPFDVLLAADEERPIALEKSGAGVADTRFTYALGSLVLWSRVLDDCLAALENPAGLHVAIANPDTAPYGAAARDFLRQAGFWEAAQPRLVTGENIAQVLQFVASGNAELGFIAHSQLRAPSLPEATCSWRVPASSHAPIEQQAILLRRAAGSEAVSQFMEYLRSDAARVIIERHGYRLPELSE